MNQFNWRRAIEGAAVTAIIAGANAAELAINNKATLSAGVIASVIATLLVAFIKGVGQSVQDASVITTQVTQPVGSTSLTETTVAASPATGSETHG